MDFNLEIRKKQLQSLKQYIRSSEDNVKAVFQTLGWTVQKTVQKDDAKVHCPVNKNHLISRETYQEHVKNCTLKSAGYNENEAFLSEPPDKSDGIIKLTNAKKLEIFSAIKGSKSDFRPAWNGREGDPLTSDRLTSTFSIDERFALYDYSIKHTKGPPKPEEFTLDILDAKEKKELSEKEKLALERDAKRRRAKYKSVHTSKKSQTEITRELIDNQMSLYTDWIKQKQEKERKEKLRRHAKEKMKSSNQPAAGNPTDQYQYIGTTYDQTYTNVYENSQYYNSVQANQGVITDWSHLYQGGTDTELYTYLGSGQYHQTNEGTYMEQNTLENSTGASYSNSAQVSTANGVTEAFRDLEESRQEKIKKRHPLPSRNTLEH